MGPAEKQQTESGAQISQRKESVTGNLLQKVFSGDASKNRNSEVAKT